MLYNLISLANMLQIRLKICERKNNQRHFHIHFQKNYKVDGST